LSKKVKLAMLSIKIVAARRALSVRSRGTSSRRGEHLSL